eukprot:1378104-Prymnesium_polylepis.1
MVKWCTQVHQEKDPFIECKPHIDDKFVGDTTQSRPADAVWRGGGSSPPMSSIWRLPRRLHHPGAWATGAPSCSCCSRQRAPPSGAPASSEPRLSRPA